jgi:hypothetical protein
MPRFMGLELSVVAILTRVVEAVVFSMLAFVLLFYIPAIVPTGLSGFVNVSGKGIGSSVLSKIIQPTAPSLGLFIVLLVFGATLARGTAVYGPLLVLNGIAFLVYVYSFFQGGVVRVTALGTAFGATGSTLSISLDAWALMAAFMLPPVLTIVKGLLLSRGGQGGRASDGNVAKITKKT